MTQLGTMDRDTGHRCWATSTSVLSEQTACGRRIHVLRPKPAHLSSFEGRGFIVRVVTQSEQPDTPSHCRCAHYENHRSKLQHKRSRLDSSRRRKPSKTGPKNWAKKFLIDGDRNPRNIQSSGLQSGRYHSITDGLATTRPESCQ